MDYHIYYLKYLKEIMQLILKNDLSQGFWVFKLRVLFRFCRRLYLLFMRTALKFTCFKGRNSTWLCSFLKLERTLRYKNIIIPSTAFYSAGTTLSSTST